MTKRLSVGRLIVKIPLCCGGVVINCPLEATDAIIDGAIGLNRANHNLLKAYGATGDLDTIDPEM